MINMGFQTHPMHMHGFHAKVIGSDQRPWTWAQSTVTGEGLEKNTITIGSGETYELLLDFSTVQVASTYDARTQTRYNPASVPPNAPASNTQTGLPVIPDPLLVPPAPYLGGPTIPTGGTGIVGLAGYNSQIFVFHNHDDYKATNNGVYPGGMFTIIQPMP
jgi:FtsP/CotA-like multicopper oxidase with cupredoxin domain